MSRYPREYDYGHGYSTNSNNNAHSHSGYEYGGNSSSSRSTSQRRRNDQRSYPEDYQDAYAEYYSGPRVDSSRSASRRSEQGGEEVYSNHWYHPREINYTYPEASSSSYHHSSSQGSRYRSQPEPESRRQSPTYRDHNHHRRGPRSPPRSSLPPAPSISRTYSTDAPRTSPYRPPALHASANLPLRPMPSKFGKRTPSPSPPPKRVPDEQYLSNSLAPSVPLPSPTELRKLLILDLNGTLLIRPARSVADNHSARPFSSSYQHKNQGSQNQSQNQAGHNLGGPRYRPVHPRPYMPTFRRYLFDKRVKDWIDVMVWSSAQPHSVGDMIGRCFDDPEIEALGEGDSRDVAAGENVLDKRKEEDQSDENHEDSGKHEKIKKGSENLLAIWARDTLGLTEREYHSKTQTTKDLAKPWAELPLSSHSPSTSEHQKHSAQTTLLLDDSPLKAQLQPYNHVCIQEYGSALRGHDLVALAKERERELALLDNGDGEVGEKAAKKRKRREKKEKARKKSDVETVGMRRSESESSVSTAPETSVTVPSEAPEESEKYDETLLAVIGILDEIKNQSNVAGWIRAGGLWGPEDLRPRTSSSARSPSPVGDTGNDAASAPTDADTPAAGEMWFDHEPSVNYWVKKGRDAVEVLGIPVEHGIVG